MRAARVQVKGLLVGDSGVGKSSVFQRMAADTFEEGIPSTIGVDYTPVTVDTKDAGPITVQLWDTAGHERYRTIISSFYRNAHVVMVVCDATSAKSVRSVPYWVSEARTRASDGVPVLILVNKCDAPPDKRSASEKALENMREQVPGVDILIVSAKTGEGIVDAIKLAAEKAFRFSKHFYYSYQAVEEKLYPMEITDHKPASPGCVC